MFTCWPVHAGYLVGLPHAKAMAEGEEIFITQTPKLDFDSTINTELAEDMYLDMFDDWSNESYKLIVEDNTMSDQELSQAVEEIENREQRFRAPVSDENVAEMSRKR